MRCRLEDLWSSAADDGASCLGGVTMTRPEDDAEVDQLLDAWFQERKDHIECALLLEQVRRFLAGLMADDALAPARRRQASRLIRSIRTAGSGDGGRERA